MPPTILVVEDNAAFRQFLTLLLETEGFRVRTATDGRTALTLLLADSQPGPALVVLDLQLPGLSGVEVLAALQAAQVAIPVICMSAAVPTAVESLPGAVAFLAKPFAWEQLLQLVACYVGTSPSPAG